ANIEIACNKESPCNHSSLDEQNFESIDSNRNENIIPDPLVDDSPDDPKGQFNQCSRSVHRELRSRFYD
ncbi:unnamed protein product, partial [Rotaria magnacalcarata]